jgi:methyl-accepting chemotaxis protein
MNQTEIQLQDLIIYDTVSEIRALAPPTLAKEQIPSVIHCAHFEKAIEKRDRLMERYNQKVSAQKEKVAALEAEVDHLTKEIKKRTDGSLVGDLMGKTLRGTKPGMFDNAEEHNKKAQKYNAILEVVRRLEDQRERALDRRNDAVEKHNEAVEEANEKLEELTAEALLVIDEDMVAVMDKANKIALRLSNSRSSDEVLAACEICFLQLKLSPILEDHFEGNTQRRDFKDRVSDVIRLFTDLCASEDLRNHKAELFRRNRDLIAKNRQLHGEILQAISSIDSDSIDQPAQTLRRLFAEKFNTNFEYKHLIDPAELADMITEIRKAINDLSNHIARVNAATEAAKEPSESAVAIQQAITATFAEMQGLHAALADDILHDNHFACEMLNEEVLDEFYSRDLKPAVLALRADIGSSVGEEELRALIDMNDDRYFLERTKAAISQANLVRLKAELDKVDSHLRGVSGLIAKAEEDINQIGEVPREQAESFRARAFTSYTLACLPWIGIAFALSLLSRVKSFEAALKSTNEIYRQLGSDIIQKNSSMKKTVLILGLVLGLGGIILFFALGLSESVAVNIAVPGTVLALYMGTTVIFGSVEKQIKEYEAFHSRP